MKRITLKKEICKILRWNKSDVYSTPKKFIFYLDENNAIENVIYFPQMWNTPKNAVSVQNWQFGNGFNIDESTSNYRIKKVADRIISNLETELDYQGIEGAIE